MAFSLYISSSAGVGARHCEQSVEAELEVRLRANGA
jgi:hypothetical protein